MDMETENKLCEMITGSDDKVSRTSRPPLLPPCRICGGNASGFHYGVNTCEACKGFFRRSFSRPVVYKCSGNNQCTILPRRRNNCPACRMKKCLSVGMSKGAIKTGRYSYEKRTQYIEEVKSINNKEEMIGQDVKLSGLVNLSTCYADSSGIVDGAPSIPGKSEDYQNIVTPKEESHASDEMNSNMVDSKDELCIKSSDIQDLSRLKANHACSKTNVNVTNGCKQQNSKIKNDQENQRIVDHLLASQDRHLEDLDSFLDKIKMKKRQKEFHHRVKLSTSDPKENSLVPTPEGETSGSDSTRMEQMMKVAELMDSEFRNTISFIKAIPGWKAFDMEDQVNLIKDGSAELWILGHCNCIDSELGVFTGEYDMSYATAASMWTDDYVGCVYKTSEIFSKMHLTKEELVVLKTVVLTFPDRQDLNNRETVEKVQWRMIECLRYVCQKNGKDFNKRFAQIMDGLIFAREMTEKFKDIVKTVVSQWSVFQKFPLLNEFFNSF